MVKRLEYLRENFASLGLISLLLFIPLYPKFPLFNIPGTYVAIRIEDLWVAAILGTWLLLEAKAGFPTFKEKTSRLILLYFLVGGVSLLSALTVTRIILPHLAAFHFLRRIEYMSLFFLAFAAVKERRNVLSFVYTLILTTIGVTIFGIGQKYFDWPVISTMNEEFSKGVILHLTEWTRISATFGGHYDLAAFALLVISLFLGFMIGIEKILLKLLGLVGALLSFYLLLLTGSRISFSAYLLAAIFILIVAKRKWWLVPVITLSLTGMILGSELEERYAATFNFEALENKISKEKDLGLVLTPTSLPTPTLAPAPAPVKPVAPVAVKPVAPQPTVPLKEATAEPIGLFPEPEPIEVATQRSGEIRFKVEWPRGLRAFKKSPLLGTGYSSVTLATDNDYLRALAETGLLGLGALFLIFLEITKEFILYLKRTKPSFERGVVIGLAGSTFGFLANAFFIDVLEASKVAFTFWMLAGIMVGIMKKIKNPVKSTAKQPARRGRGRPRKAKR